MAPGDIIPIDNRIETTSKKESTGNINLLYVTEYEGTVSSVVMSFLMKNWDLEKLEEECGYHLIVVEKLQLDGKDISSTRIRASLEKGDMEEASALLGRNYSVSGEIVHGNALGRTIQVPTINQKVPSFKLLPPNGVYVSKIHWNDEVYYGITNIGTKPTVNDTSEKTVETNIFDFDKDVYGEKMVVELLHYHRKESRFSSVEALQTQLFKDIEFGKQFVAKIR